MIQFPKLFARTKSLVVQQAPNIMIFILFVLVLILCTKAFFLRSDYFRVRTAEARGFTDSKTAAALSGEITRLYKNKNIFEVNVKGLASALAARYPDTKNVVVKRDYPDRLTLYLIFRRPVALLSDGKYYPVDDDGVIIVNVDPRLTAGLSVITGIDAGAVRAGSSKNIAYALQLLREIKKARFLSSQLPVVISAADSKSISFFLKNGVEVKIGSENYKDRLNALKKMIKDPRMLWDKIKYIDLRFKDVVIGPR